MQKMLDWIVKYKILLLLAGVAVLLVCAYNIDNRKRQAQEKPAVITQEQTQDAKALQRQLDISRKNTDELRRELVAAQAGQRAPAATYYVHVPTVERAAQVMEQQIKAGATMIDGKAYATAGYEQGRFEALMHFDGTKPHGASVMYRRTLSQCGAASRRRLLAWHARCLLLCARAFFPRAPYRRFHGLSGAGSLAARGGKKMKFPQNL